MKKIYSKVNPGVLLHVVNRLKDTDSSRLDITPVEQYLQVSLLNMNKGKTFTPHKHIEQIRTTDRAQESWIVFKGRVKAILYDLDDTIIITEELGPGDCSITFQGAHNFECLEDETVVYEYKTGPYQGREKDKVLIDEA